MSEYQCEKCDKKLSKSGYYKHIKKCGIEEPVEEEIHGGEPADSILVSHPAGESESSPDTPTSSSWMDYEPTIENNVTERLPTPLKFVDKLATAKPKKKYTAKELKEIKKANIALLKMGLGATDFLISKYGPAVTDNKDYECVHSDTDKTIVANAQNAWLEENGVNLSQHFGKGKIALVMTGYYIAPPILKIQKKRTKKLIKWGFLKTLKSKLRFKRKKKVVIDNEEFSE